MVDWDHTVPDRIQWWIAFIWFMIESSDGLHSFEDPVYGLQSYDSRKDPVVGCSYMVQDRIQWWTAFILFGTVCSGRQLGSL
jgi:hypothetical protein